MQFFHNNYYVLFLALYCNENHLKQHQVGRVGFDVFTNTALTPHSVLLLAILVYNREILSYIHADS